MGSELKGNAIVSGLIDYYCLACECHLRCEQDARLHVDTPLHRENLPLYPYLERFQEDRVRKIKKLYFCELCNLTFTTISKINVHSKEADHIYKRRQQHIKRFKNYVIISDGMLITELAWNGILDDNTCIVCSTEVDDVTVHLAEPKHVLNIIRSEAQFDEGIVYRKIDETSFQCLVCNNLFAFNTISTHSDSEKHKERILNCRADFDSYALEKDKSASNTVEDKSNSEVINTETIEAVRKLDPSATKNDKTSNNVKEDGRSSTKDAVFEQLSEFQKNGIKINLESEVVSCSKCSETMKLDTEIIKQHIVSHKNDATKSKPNTHVIQPSHSKTDIRNKVQKNTEQSKHTTPEIESDNEMIKIDLRKPLPSESNESWSTVDSDNDDQTSSAPQAQSSATAEKSEENLKAVSFAKENEITYNIGRSDAYCRTCGVRLPSTLKSMIEHVNGAPHKSKSTRKTTPSNYFGNGIKMPLKLYIKTFIFVKEDDAIEDAVINMDLCVTRKSFLLITGLKNRCLVCEENVSDREIDEHAETSTHRELLMIVPIITAWNKEFIREVRLGIFHCGFCNLVVGSWSEMENHLKCSDHKKNRDACRARLEEHLPYVHAHRVKEHFERVMMMRLLRNLF